MGRIVIFIFINFYKTISSLLSLRFKTKINRGAFRQLTQLLRKYPQT